MYVLNNYIRTHILKELYLSIYMYMHRKGIICMFEFTLTENKLYQDVYIYIYNCKRRKMEPSQIFH